MATRALLRAWNEGAPCCETAGCRAGASGRIADLAARPARGDCILAGQAPCPAALAPFAPLAISLGVGMAAQVRLDGAVPGVRPGGGNRRLATARGSSSAWAMAASDALNGLDGEFYLGADAFFGANRRVALT